jgi:hypothetical protein
MVRFRDQREGSPGQREVSCQRVIRSQLCPALQEVIMQHHLGMAGIPEQRLQLSLSVSKFECQRP